MVSLLVELGSVAEVYSGLTVTSRRLQQPVSPVRESVPVVGMTALQGDDSVNIDRSTVTDRSFAARCLVAPGDILVSSRSTQIRTCLVSGETEPFAINATLLGVRPDPAQLDPGFLLAYLRHPVGQANLLRIAGSSTAQLNITVRALESLPIPLPSINEQKQLADLYRAAEDYRRRAIEVAETSYRIAGELIFRNLLPTETT